MFRGRVLSQILLSPVDLNPNIVHSFQRLGTKVNSVMAKRKAETPLENTAAQNSPASKKVRVDDLSDQNKSSTSFSPPREYVVANGRGRKNKEEQQDNISPTVDQETELDETSSLSFSNELQDEKSAYSAASRQTAPLDGFTDLYLDTIDRSVLDFDFEKLCSVTLSNINVYACLVCGKYYQGRGPKSHAYFHALEVGHHVYVNMLSKRVYVLPEGYEVKSRSLEDIKFVVDPQLSKDEVIRLDTEPKDALDLSGKKYRPGMVALSFRSKASEFYYRIRRNEQYQRERLF